MSKVKSEDCGVQNEPVITLESLCGLERTCERAHDWLVADAAMEPDFRDGVEALWKKVKPEVRKLITRAEMCRMENEIKTPPHPFTDAASYNQFRAKNPTGFMSESGSHPSKQPIELEHLRCVNLQPGDVLVYQTQETLSEDQKEMIRGVLCRKFPGAEHLIVDGGATLVVLRPQGADGQQCGCKVPHGD